MENTKNFNDILALSKKLETERLDRELNVIMQDEYELDDDLQKSLKDGTYQFPNALQAEINKWILIFCFGAFSPDFPELYLH